VSYTAFAWQHPLNGSSTKLYIATLRYRERDTCDGIIKPTVAMLPRYCQVALVYSLKIRELLKSLNAGILAETMSV
jgi:hypothetical protein